MKHSYSSIDTCFSIDVIDEILEEDFDALLNKGSKILHSIKGTLLEKEIFAKFDEFMAMIADENSDSESLISVKYTYPFIPKITQINPKQTKKWQNPDINTGSLKLNAVGPLVNTASSHEHDSPEYMFTMGVSSTLEATHIESFSDEDEPEVDLGNIINFYIVPTTPNTRIHKDHPIDNVIGDVKSSVQTRKMTKTYFEHRVFVILSNSSWVECIAEETSAIKLQQVWILVDLPNGKKAIRTK
ncbi:hypothetical protein Tco_0807155 [Tanacetum coccineum]